MAPVKITFSDRSASPPIYVAGSFTNWEAIEIDFTAVKDDQGQDQHIFEKTFDIAPGTHQYKFRLGPGDWWVCDTQSPQTRDDAGNENNEIVVKPEPTPEPQPVQPVQPVQAVQPEPAKPEPVKAASTHHNVTIVNEAPRSKTNGNAQPATNVSPAVVPDAEPSYEPVAKVNGTSKDISEKVNEPEAEPVVMQEEVASASVVPEAEEAGSGPVSNTVDGASSPKPVIKESKSKDSSVSSLPAKEEVSEKKEYEPKKSGWFSRIFLCGSSRQ